MVQWEYKTLLVKKFSFLDEWPEVLKEKGWQFVTFYAPDQGQDEIFLYF